MTHRLYIALCVHHSESNLLSSCTWPPLPFTAHYLPLLWWQPCCCLCLWVLFVVFICCFQFCIAHVSESYSSWLFFVLLILLSKVFSRSIHVIAMAIFLLFLRLSSIPASICHLSTYLSICPHIDIYVHIYIYI